VPHVASPGVIIAPHAFESGKRLHRLGIIRVLHRREARRRDRLEQLQSARTQLPRTPMILLGVEL
jgi:hypothetical protein